MCSVLRQSLAKRTMGLANQQLVLRHVGQSLDSSGKVGSVREGGPVGSGIQIPWLVLPKAVVKATCILWQNSQVAVLCQGQGQSEVPEGEGFF